LKHAVSPPFQRAVARLVTLARAGRMVGMLGASALFGCSSIPAGRSAIDSVDLSGAHALPATDVTNSLATTATPKFLGLFRGVVFDYEVFDASALQRDLARVERYYRGHGFLEAHARTGRVIHVSSNHVRVEIVVDEGPPTVNRLIRILGLDMVPPQISDEVWLAASKALPAGARFEEDTYKKAQVAVTRALTDRGYAFAKVDTHAQIDLATHAIDYTFTTQPGPPVVFGKITIVGLDPDAGGPLPQEIDEAPLRRALDIKEGTPYSTAEIDTATQALLDLEVFSSVQIEPDLSDPSAHAIPLVVKTEPTKLRVIRLGGGAEFDEIKTEIHGLAGWEDHNFFGGLRDLSVDFSPGVVLYPMRADNIPRPPIDQLLPEERLKVQFRQPGFPESRTNLYLRPELNVSPWLVSPTELPAVVGYVEPRGAVGLDRRFGSHLLASIGHNVQGEIPFAYRNELDPTLPGVVLSYPQLITTLDFRDDAVHPHLGFFLANDFQVAGGPFGGSATDVRIQPDIRGYLPIGQSLTFAARGSLGFLFPTNYGYTENAQGALSPPNRDIEIVYFRGFFSGGPDSNRGYPLRGVSPHGAVPFLNPATARMQVAAGKGECDPTAPNYMPKSPDCSFPLGGFTQWEASAELRINIPGPLNAAAFCDAGDVSPFVFPNAQSIRLSYLHMSCGVGARYDTPVGPIRLDIGYRIQPLQLLGEPNEQAAFNDHPTFGLPPVLFYTIPAAVAFGIGESF
jgi:outer membrane protein insertion porin family/translocation and assembly module TamA